MLGRRGWWVLMAVLGVLVAVGVVTGQVSLPGVLLYVVTLVVVGSAGPARREPPA